MIPVTKAILCTTVGDLTRSKKHRDWVDLNSVPLLLFLTEAAILEGEMAAKNLLKVFAKCIDKKEVEEEDKKLAKEEEDNLIIEGRDTEDKK